MDVGPIHFTRLLVAAAVGLVAGAGGLENGYGIFLLSISAIGLLACCAWIYLQPAQRPLLDGALAGACAGTGPAVALGMWWYWWSDFCIFSCEGVAKQPSAFWLWFLGTLVTAVALGFAAALLGSRALRPAQSAV